MPSNTLRNLEEKLLMESYLGTNVNGYIDSYNILSPFFSSQPSKFPDSSAVTLRLPETNPRIGDSLRNSARQKSEKEEANRQEAY